MSLPILLVDDNAIQSATRKAILERAGFRTTTSTNGRAAIDILSELGPGREIGLLITDHVMPEMDGPQLVREVRSRGINLPIIVLSGLPDAEHSYDGLGVAFRSKPFPPDALIALAGELLQDSLCRTA